MVRTANSSAIELALMATLSAAQVSASTMMVIIRSRGVGRVSNSELNAVSTVSMPL